jgi:uncharacterized protein YndB with AHSA1/START domain
MNRAATFELTLNRHIRAPREKVFDAFVTEKAMREWMCPRGLAMAELELDARVGGGFRLAMRARDGDSYRAVASYREIARPERLVYTWQWVGEGMPNVETLITVTFAERDGGTDPGEKQSIDREGLAEQQHGSPQPGRRRQAPWLRSPDQADDLADHEGQAERDEQERAEQQQHDEQHDQQLWKADVPKHSFHPLSSSSFLCLAIKRSIAVSTSRLFGSDSPRSHLLSVEYVTPRW